MSKPSCFIIMPLTTPDHYVETYKGDTRHFYHVLDHLFKPAIITAGMEPIPPISKGSEVIHGDIIRNLEMADLVLCDMSILNPNVFFELGIRTALNKSVAMVRDDATPNIPFDLNMVNHSTYKSSLNPWDLETEVEKMKVHLEDCMKNGPDNSLWGHFSMTQQAKISEDSPEVEKQMSYLIRQVETLQGQLDNIKRNPVETGPVWSAKSLQRTSRERNDSNSIKDELRAMGQNPGRL